MSEKLPEMCMCKHYDASNKRCSLMGIAANTTVADPKTRTRPNPEDPNSKDRAIQVCSLQVPNWLPRALPCRVPELEQREIQVPYYNMVEVMAAATQVMNRMARKDGQECGNCVGSSSSLPPNCKLVESPCPRIDRQTDCKLARHARNIDNVDSPRAIRDMEQIYDEIWNEEVLGQDPAETALPGGGARVSTPLDRYRRRDGVVR